MAEENGGALKRRPVGQAEKSRGWTEMQRESFNVLFPDAGTTEGNAFHPLVLTARSSGVQEPVQVLGGCSEREGAESGPPGCFQRVRSKDLWLTIIIFPSVIITEGGRKPEGKKIESQGGLALLKDKK